MYRWLVSNFQAFDTSARVAVKTLVDNSTFFNFTSGASDCMFTKRTGQGEVFTQTLDYRLINSPADLGTLITY